MQIPHQWEVMVNSKKYLKKECHGFHYSRVKRCSALHRRNKNEVISRRRSQSCITTLNSGLAPEISAIIVRAYYPSIRLTRPLG